MSTATGGGTVISAADTGEVVLRAPNRWALACYPNADCVWSDGRETRLTSLTGAHPEVSFDGGWYGSPEGYPGHRPLVLAGQVLWADDELMIGDRSTGEVAVVDGLGQSSGPGTLEPAFIRGPEAVPGGVLIGARPAVVLPAGP